MGIRIDSTMYTPGTTRLGLFKKIRRLLWKRKEA